jgi:8-oxo-dGTP pyrophosphatase MutT (NUDIX family)
MSAGARNLPDSRFGAFRSVDRTPRTAVEFVRLSDLRRLSEREQVAAVCYRVRGEGVEFLLVRTRGGERWTFPKGSAEPGLTHAQAAALEAFEEAGVHGRIEEVPFARYIRRRRGGAGKSAERRGKKEVAVYAHLCEVSRLSPPKESGRNRTWFSVEEAKWRLCEGRKTGDGAEFVRVIDQAVARIQRLHGGGIDVVDRGQDDRARQDLRQPEMLPKDALQKVQFEAFVEVHEASLAPYIRRQLRSLRQFAVPAVPIVDGHSREVLRGEVLQFDPTREKKAKALGTGARNA